MPSRSIVPPRIARFNNFGLTLCLQLPKISWVAGDNPVLLSSLTKFINDSVKSKAQVFPELRVVLCRKISISKEVVGFIAAFC